MTDPKFRGRLLLAGALVLFLVAGKYLWGLGLPFFLGALTAFGAEPGVRFLEKRLRLPRAAAAGIGVTLTLGMAFLAVLGILGLVFRQMGSLVWLLPDLEQTALRGMDTLEQNLLNLSARAPKALCPLLTRCVTGLFSNGTAFLDRVTGGVLRVASGVVTHIPDGALSFGTWILASFMLSAELPRLRAALRERSWWTDRVRPLLGRLKGTLGHWLLAQIKLMGLTFLILGAGFFLLRIPQAPLWAGLVALVDAFPILGTGTVLVPWSLVCLLQGDPLRGVGLLGIFALTALSRSVLEPRLVGKELGLSPLATLFFMYAGFRFWGVSGMLLAPLAAVALIEAAREFKKM